MVSSWSLQSRVPRASFLLLVVVTLLKANGSAHNLPIGPQAIQAKPTKANKQDEHHTRVLQEHHQHFHLQQCRGRNVGQELGPWHSNGTALLSSKHCFDCRSKTAATLHFVAIANKSSSSAIFEFHSRPASLSGRSQRFHCESTDFQDQYQSYGD